MILIELLVGVLGVYISLYVLYCLLLLGIHFFIKEKDRPKHAPEAKFAIIIPAHDEELLLPRLLKSINLQTYPINLFKSIVIADNCTDSTAKLGIDNRALVLERSDYNHQGKGYAIKWALENINLEPFDAILIIDADSVMKNDVLWELNQIVSDGKSIIQCYNGIINPNESWFTRLLDVSRTIENEMYLPAKEKIGLSSHLMGTGMCFSKNILLKYGWESFTVGEDWEYYAKVTQAGENISFAELARIYHQESSSLRQATSQRMRWSSGRFAIAWKYGYSLFFQGLKEKNIIKLDGSLPLLFPNPSLGINLTALILLVSFTFSKNMHQTFFVGWNLALILIQFGIFNLGVLYTQNKFQKLSSLFIAPLFLIWKLGIDIYSLLGLAPKKWIRTERNPSKKI